jgi:hypothetical protein
MDTAEVVVAYYKTLTDADVEFGRRLWHQLRANRKFPISGMLWLFEPEAVDWHLVIASPVVDKLGPRDAYRKLAEVGRLDPAVSGQLLRIELVGTTHPLYQALRSVFAQTASVEGARLGGSQVGGMYIEDAYLYGVR